jgi:hypothetical protein
MLKHIEEIKEYIKGLEIKIEETKNIKCDELLDQTNKKTQSYFTCPIKGEIMLFPVTLDCGHTFEKEAILKWLKDKNDATCPVCLKKQFYHNVCRIENNINMIQLIDEFYGEYRKIKLQTEQKIETKKNYNEISREYMKKTYNEIIIRINEVVDWMLKNGTRGCSPRNEGWNDFMDKITDNIVIKEMVIEYLQTQKLELTWNKVEYSEEVEVLMEGKKRKMEKKQVTKYRYENCRLGFIN